MASRAPDGEAGGLPGGDLGIEGGLGLGRERIDDRAAVCDHLPPRLRGAAAPPDSRRPAGLPSVRPGRCRGSWRGRKTAAAGPPGRSSSARSPARPPRPAARPSSSSKPSTPGPPWPEKWMPVGFLGATVRTRLSSVPSSVGVSSQWSVRRGSGGSSPPRSSGRSPPGRRH